MLKTAAYQREFCHSIKTSVRNMKLPALQGVGQQSPFSEAVTAGELHRLTRYHNAREPEFSDTIKSRSKSVSSVMSVLSGGGRVKFWVLSERGDVSHSKLFSLCSY